MGSKEASASAVHLRDHLLRTELVVTVTDVARRDVHRQSQKSTFHLFQVARVLVTQKKRTPIAQFDTILSTK